METPGLLVHGEAAPFSTALRSLLNNPQYSDVCFVVGQERQEVFAHRCLLACRCNFFQRLLGPKLGSGMPSPVVLSTVPAEAFLAVLEFLYTNSVRLHRHSVLEVLTAAIEYGLEELRELCLEFVVKVLDVELVCEALQVAVTFGLGRLQERCLAFIEAHSQEALRTRGFLELSAPALLSLLRSDKLRVDEAELVLAARSWARVGCAGAAGGRGGGPGSAGAETGFAGPGGAECPGRAEPAGAAHPGGADRRGVEMPRSAKRGCGPGRPVPPPEGNPAPGASLLSGPAL
ncbi:BTB/POZ domain-containing protein 19 isoform X3 [Neofelis nebulosa]|uniref:BTB/POZ domain-containing protein 19 isoform X3 n=1 Tax=Neofelis nebulosa TaxID=61452 RepID=UPI00272D2EBF|nr:BTB/POZ domain-containing protein 19 isoform X3 [Neofelis nebulosa]